MDGSPPVAWVTGASSGIGRAVALKLAERGWSVAASARREAELQSLVEESSTLSGTIEAFSVDITDRERVLAVANNVIKRFGSIELAFLCAGTFVPMGIEDWDLKTFDNTVRLNLLGTAICVDAVLPHFKARRSGHFAFVSSAAGLRGLPMSVAYGASKSAVTYMAESLRLETKSSGIKVQVVHPGFVKTPLTDQNDFPMPFLMDVENAADQIVRGLESNRFEIAFPRLFVWMMKTVGLLPNWLYFPLVGKATASRG